MPGLSALRRFRVGLPPSFWWLWGGTFVNALATFVFSFLALYLTQRGFSVTRTGLILSLFGGGSIVASPVAGFLADHIGRRPTLVLSLVSSALATALLASLRAPAAIAAAVLLLGLVTNAFRPALYAMVADLVEPPHRPRAYGLLYWAINLGMAVSLVVGGLLASHGYVRLFMADAATTLLFAAVVWRQVPETRVAAGARTNTTRGYGTVWRDRPFLTFLVVNFAFLLVFWQFQVAMPIDMARHGFGPASFGRALAMNGLVIVTLQPFSGVITGRLAAHRALALAAVLVAIGFGAYAFCETEAHFAAATAVWSVGEILALPVASALVADLSPADLRGRYQGAFGLSFGLGMLVAPALGCAVLDALGARTLWMGCLTLGLAVAAAHLAWTRAPTRAV